MQAQSDHDHEPTQGRTPDVAPEPATGVWNTSYRMARRIGVAVVGSTVLAVGLILLVTPGPAFVVIPIGLGILSLEFAWAKRWLDKVKEQAAKVVGSSDQRAA